MASFSMSKVNHQECGGHLGQPSEPAPKHRCSPGLRSQPRPPKSRRWDAGCTPAPSCESSSRCLSADHPRGPWQFPADPPVSLSCQNGTCASTPVHLACMLGILQGNKCRAGGLLSAIVGDREISQPGRTSVTQNRWHSCEGYLLSICILKGC